MSEHLNRDEFLAHIAPIREDIKELVSLQREQNSKVAKHDTRLTLLEERTPPGRIATSGISAVVSGVITGLGMWLSSQK
jgi:hypothetical protein